MSESNKQAVRSVAVTVSAQAIKFIIGLGATMILARSLTPSDYGLVAMVAVFTGLVAIFRDGGLSIATVQRAEVNDAQLSTLFWINAALGFGLALIVVLISPLIGWFYNNDSLICVALALAISFFFSGLSAQPQALLQRQMRFKAIAFIEIASLIISAGLGVAAASAGWHYWSLVIMNIASVFINTVLVFFLCRWRPSPPSRANGIRSMLKFGGELTAMKFLDSCSSSLDSLSIGRLFNAEMVGLYSRAQTLMLLPVSQFMPPLLSVLLPVMSRLFDSNKNMNRVFIDILQLAVFASSIITVCLFVGSDWLVGIMFGSQWMESSVLLRLLCGTGFFIPLSTLCVASLIALGKGNTLIKWSLVKSAATVFAILAGAAWGARGVSLSLSISAIFFLLPILNQITAKSGLGSLSEIWRATGLGVAVCTFTCAAMLFVRTQVEIENPLIGLAALFLASTAFHIFIMWALPSSRQVLLRMLTAISISRTSAR